MAHIEIPNTRCKCGQMVGDVASNYQIMKENGMDHSEIIEELGVKRICCLISLGSATSYPLKRARVGTKSIESKKKEKIQEETRKVYRLESGQHKTPEESFNPLSVIKTSSFSTKQIVKLTKKEREMREIEREKKERDYDYEIKTNSEIYNEKHFSNIEKAKENSSKAPIEGIKEFIPEEDIEDLEKGQIVSMGFVTDDKNETIFIHVGEGYHVPILKVYYSLVD
jgi:DNA-directed RNA polymerase subunit N (RpoN/RPB10)